MKRVHTGLVALVVFSLSSCSIFKWTQKSQQKEDRVVTIVAVNDMHAAIDQFPRLGYMVDSLRSIYPNLLLVSAGDNQTGNPISDQYETKGLPIIHLMNSAGFDLSAVGNHEFDTSPEGFAHLAEVAQFPFVCSNIRIPSSSKLSVRPYIIFTTKDKVKIAVASLLQINTTGIPDCHPEKVKDFGFDDPILVGAAHQHLKDSADVLIYLNHLGIEGDIELTQHISPSATPLIIGGHSHTKIDKETIHNGIMITQAASKLKYLTLIRLVLKSDGSIRRSMSLLPISSGGQVRKDIQTQVDQYNNTPHLKETIATAQEELANKEQVGYLTVDALRLGTNTELSLINPGGVRTDRLSKGNITAMDVYTLDPFGNEIVILNLSGQELLNLHYSAFELDNRMPLYSSGYRSQYVLYDDGSIKSITLLGLDGKPLDLNKTYSVSMNSYISSMYPYEHRNQGQAMGKTTAENMVDYLKRIKIIPSYKQEKRISIRKESSLNP